MESDTTPLQAAGQGLAAQDARSDNTGVSLQAANHRHVRVRDGHRGRAGAGPVRPRPFDQRHQGRRDGREHLNHRRPRKMQSEGSSDEASCVVCTGELTYYAVGECNHPAVCSKCTLRSRVLLRDRACPMCKTTLEKTVVAVLAGGAPQSYESFNVWGDTAGPGSDFDADSGMLYHQCRQHFQDMMRLAALRCPVRGCKEEHSLPNKEALREHTRKAHQRNFCALCLEHRPLFVPEQELFTQAQLKAHEAAVGGHPVCRFCSSRFFDSTALYHHMNGTHINCHLCPQDQQHRYYRDTPQLHDHLRTAHFLCERPPCSQATVAFGTVDEYKVHLAADHGAQDSHIGVNFQVRRAGRDGTGIHREDADLRDGVFVEPPQGAGASRDRSAISSGLFRQRSADFPTLANAGAGSGGPFLGGPGWGGRGGGALDATPLSSAAFPSLPPPSTQPATRPTDPRRAPPPPISAARALAAGQTPARAQASAPPARPQSLQGGMPIYQDPARTQASNQQARPLALQGGMPTYQEPRTGVATAVAAAADRKEEEDKKLQRNKRMAEALGIQLALGAGAGVGGPEALAALRERMQRPLYTKELVAWAKNNMSELVKLERRIEEMLKDPRGTSIQTKPMPREQRARVHALAEAYGLKGISYDAEPRRYMSLIKQRDAAVPDLLLSQAARDPKYMPADGPVHPTAAQAPASAAAATVTPAPRALRPAHPENSLEIYSIQEGVTGQQILSRLRRLVPGAARTVLGFYSASGAGVTGTPAMVELSSRGAAKRALEALNKEIEAATAQAKVAKTSHTPPFRARLQGGTRATPPPPAADPPDEEEVKGDLGGPVGLPPPPPPQPPRVVNDSWEDDEEPPGNGSAAAPPLAEVKHSKWESSVLGGRLVKPQGKTTLLDERRQAAEEEKAQKAQWQAERRRRQEDQRREKEDNQRLEAHSTMWEGLASDEDSDSEKDGEAVDGAAAQRAAKRSAAQAVAEGVSERSQPSIGSASLTEEMDLATGAPMWRCTACTLWNSLDRSLCEACGTDRPNNSWIVAN